MLVLSALEDIRLSSRLLCDLRVEGIRDEVAFRNGIGVGCRCPEECRHNTVTFFNLAVGHEPTRRLGQDQDTTDESHREQDLHSNGESPGHRGL